jgi:hypothetical protein
MIIHDFWKGLTNSGKHLFRYAKFGRCSNFLMRKRHESSSEQTNGLINDEE